MRHGSLFSGIGGFDLAAEWMGWENVFHCEWMEFPRKVLDYHFPNADSHIDICKTDFRKYANTIDVLTGGFPCQPFSSSGQKKGQKMNATCGVRCYEQYKKLNPHSSSLKMSLVSSTLMADWYSTRCALTWKLKATKFNRLLLVLQVKTHRTADIAAGLLEFLPTPMVSDWRGSKIKRKGNTQLTETLGISSQLNPRFVAEMMGFPPNWTELPFQNGEQNPSRDTETP